MTNLNYENSRFLDVVNKDDKIVDSKSRSDVHHLGLLHREVHVWMFDENYSIFFQKRGLHRPSAGLLDATVGGHVNKGEDYLDAAVRETKEETGISIKPSDLIILKKVRDISAVSKENFSDTSNNFIRMVYLYKYPVNEKLIKKEHGIPGAGFKKLSLEFLSNTEKEYEKMFHRFALKKEVPQVLKYIKKGYIKH